VPKARDVEVERRNLGEASQTLSQVLVPYAEAKVRQVAGGVGHKQDAAGRPRQRKLPGAMTGYMDRS
jgi:hypothetical protein